MNSCTGPSPHLLHRWLYAPSGAAEFQQPTIDMGLHKWAAPVFFIGNLRDWCRCGHGRAYHGPNGCTFESMAFKCDCSGLEAQIPTPCGAPWMPGWDYRNNKQGY